MTNAEANLREWLTDPTIRNKLPPAVKVAVDLWILELNLRAGGFPYKHKELDNHKWDAWGEKLKTSWQSNDSTPLPIAHIKQV